MQNICSSLSFLNRNGMDTLLIYGPEVGESANKDILSQVQQLQLETTQLVDFLEKTYNIPTRTFCGSSGIIASETSQPRCLHQ